MMELLKGIMMATTAAAIICGAFTGCADKNMPEHSADNPLPTDSLSAMDFSTLEEMADTAEEIGSFVITLYPEYAPESCENFRSLIEEGFYDGLTFHRIEDGFVAQGGSPDGTSSGTLDKKVKGEFAANGYTQNTLSHTRGIVSMARPGNNMDGASCQFFICLSDDYTGALDGNYAAFGEVTEGMEVVDKFLTVERTEDARGTKSSPTVPITIKKAEMIGDDGDGHHRARFTMTIG